MKQTNAQRKTNIINNINYLIKSRSETKTSFSVRCGLTRAAVYNIMEGRVNTVQRSTINKISDFFGISSYEIEYSDIEEIEKKREDSSVNGNKNPLAVPVIPQSMFLSSLEKTVGYLVTKYPLTYSFNHQSEVVAMKVEQDFADVFAPGDILIIRRVAVSQEGLLDVYEAPRNKIKIKNKHGFIGEPHREETIDSCCEKIIGHIIEERCLSIVLP